LVEVTVDEMNLDVGTVDEGTVDEEILAETNTTPVIFVHGVGLDRTMWNGVLALMGTRPVVAYDMINHGDARRQDGTCTLDMFVDQLADVVDQSGDGKSVDVVGFSMGALVAQGFAVAYPTRVRRLALLHTVYDRSARERADILERVHDVRNGGFSASVDAALKRWFTPAFAGEDPDTVAEIRSVLERNDVLAYSFAYELFATADAELVDSVKAITCPTLVMTGEDDPRSTPAMSNRLAQQLQCAHSVVLPGLRHMAPVESPETVAARLQTFFAS
jgi:(E)-2-((N-methylformamido)methylene)succinate hydrolase